MTPTALFALVCVLTLVVVWIVGPEAARDPGGYSDRWTGQDKAWHAVSGALTCLMGILVFDVLPWPALAVASLAWAGVELAQYAPRRPYARSSRGFASYRDWLASTAGAAAIALIFLTMGA